MNIRTPSPARGPCQRDVTWHSALTLIRKTILHLKVNNLAANWKLFPRISGLDPLGLGLSSVLGDFREIEALE